MNENRHSYIYSFFGALIVITAGILPAHAFDYFQPLPDSPPYPRDNPANAQRELLGRTLFFDNRLSIDGSLSCNHCHNVLAAGEDGRAVSTGINGQKTRRSTPSLWNAGFQTVMFWDGRAASMELAIEEHFTDNVTGGFSGADQLERRIRQISGYTPLFKQAFGKDTITVKTISQALASYIRTLRTPDSPYDRYLKGDKKALSAAALRGMEEFREVECLSCHFGVNFAGPAPGPAMGLGDGFYELFPNHTGSEYDARYHLTDDLGRIHFTLNKLDIFMWRVPPLRNIARTAPYFHNGAVGDLAEAVRVMAMTQLRKKLTDQQVKDIVAFLESLTGNYSAQTIPSIPGNQNHSPVGP